MKGGSGVAARLYLRCAPAEPARRSRPGRVTILALVFTGTKEIVAPRAADNLLPTIQRGGCHVRLRRYFPEASVIETYQLHRTRLMARLPLDAEIRAKNIVEQLGGVWRGTRGECRCPAHDDGSPSLSVRLGDSAILFHCFAGCTASEVLRALQRRKLHDRSAVAMPEGTPKRDMGALALRLWNASSPIAGTLAEEYLLARGLSAPYPKALRFNPATILGSGADRRVMPAMIAAVENDLGVVAVQRTFLATDNVLRKPIPKPKVALGLLGTAAIRLAPATHELGLAEGIEDARSATEWFGTPTWALGGVERLAFVAIPEKVRRVIVYGDRGFAAERLLEKARDHLTANGRELISRVPERHDDWNDAWRAHLRDR